MSNLSGDKAGTVASNIPGGFQPFLDQGLLENLESVHARATAHPYLTPS